MFNLKTAEAALLKEVKIFLEKKKKLQEMNTPAIKKEEPRSRFRPIGNNKWALA
ncbi:MAG: hypothetical protein PF572_00170 [Patescibacteria group bacterium]|jgi:hypothetical protein|nr:hypothetical protein [Patescibacteria group bacterium]